jgi:hypothetical protein
MPRDEAMAAAAFYNNNLAQSFAYLDFRGNGVQDRAAPSASGAGPSTACRSIERKCPH